MKLSEQIEGAGTMSDPTEADRAKARALLKSMEAAVHPEMRVCFVDCVAYLIAARYAAGLAEGRRQMREEAAQVCLVVARERRAGAKICDEPDRTILLNEAVACFDCVPRIRALPDHPETSAPVKED